MIKNIKLEQQYLRKVSFNQDNLDGQFHEIYHAYPRIKDFVAGDIPDKVNPRPRPNNDEILKGRVPRSIEITLRENPNQFHLANRGCTIFAKTATYYKDTQTLTLDFDNDDKRYGIPDGRTTDAVIYSLQHGEEPVDFDDGRLHLEIITGLNDEKSIVSLAEGRNTSKQVQEYSISNLKQAFQWVKDTLETQAYSSNIGYEENANNSVDVLEILAIVNLFHPDFDDNDAPMESYSQKGKVQSKYMKEFESKRTSGFKALMGILTDVLNLHDILISEVPRTYNDNGGKIGHIGNGPTQIFGKYRIPKKLNFSEHSASHKMPGGVLYPLLASFRSLTKFDETSNTVVWAEDFLKFWERHKTIMVSEMFTKFKNDCKSDPTICGKSTSTYSHMYNLAARLSEKDKNEELQLEVEKLRRALR